MAVTTAVARVGDAVVAVNGVEHGDDATGTAVDGGLLWDCCGCWWLLGWCASAAAASAADCSAAVVGGQ